MTALVWTELESFSGRFADAQKRLEAAKSVGSFDVAAVLEREMAEMEEQRGNLLRRIANSFLGEEVGAAAEEETAKALEAAQKQNEVEATEQASEGQKDESEGTGLVGLRGDEATEPQGDETPEVRGDEATELTRGSGTVNSIQSDPNERDRAMWQQVTSADVDRARHELGRQRTEMLVRHAEELKSLDAEVAEVDALEQAIAFFVGKFSGAAGTGEVVPFDRSAEAHKSAS